MCNADYLTVPEEQIKDIETLLMVVADKVTYAAKPFDAYAPPARPAVSPLDRRCSLRRILAQEVVAMTRRVAIIPVE